MSESDGKQSAVAVQAMLAAGQAMAADLTVVSFGGAMARRSAST